MDFEQVVVLTIEFSSVRTIRDRMVLAAIPGARVESKDATLRGLVEEVKVRAGIPFTKMQPFTSIRTRGIYGKSRRSRMGGPLRPTSIPPSLKLNESVSEHGIGHCERPQAHRNEQPKGNYFVTSHC